DRDAARLLAERALEARAGHVEAQVVLARLDEGRRDFGAVKAGVSALLARPDLGFENRGPLLILLGDALDADGDYAGAFEAYREGKAQISALYVRNHGRQTDGVIATVEKVAAGKGPAAKVPAPARAQAAAPRHDPDGPDAHVFLIGFPRSGTTLLEQVL